MTDIERINGALATGRNLQIPGIVGAGGILWGKCDRLRLGNDGAPYVARYGKFQWWLLRSMPAAIIKQNGLSTTLLPSDNSEANS